MLTLMTARRRSTSVAPHGAQAVTPQGTAWRVRRHVLLWRLRYRWDLLGSDDPVVALVSASSA